MINKRKEKIDIPLLVVLILLLSVGVLMVTSASWPEGIKMFKDGFHYTKLQVVYIILGCVLMYISSKVPIRAYKNLSFIMFLISFGLVMLLYTGAGREHYGQVRWLNIPIINREFMPSDLIKFTSIFYLARFLDENMSALKKANTFVIILLIFAMSVVPIILKDFSTSIVVAASLLSVFFIMGISLYQWLTMGIAGWLGVKFLLIDVPYRYERLTAFIDPFDDLSDSDFQLAHSLYAIGMGSFSGVGPFQSRQKYTYIPKAHNDFIFSIIGEEFGFVGGLFVMLLFMFFVYRGYYIAINARTRYEKLVAVGITTSIGLQAFFNIGVTMGILPVTGITLPFISYGGTSIMITLIAVGVLFGISKRRR